MDFLKLFLKYFGIGLLCLLLLQSCHISIPSHHIANCLVVKHQLGTSCIPATAQRVVVMDQESLEILLALDFPIIAAPSSNRVADKRAIFTSQLLTSHLQPDQIVNLGKEGQPNLEKIATLKPDLIVGTFIDANLYRLISAIAPTIPLEYNPTGWRESLWKSAGILQRQDRAKYLLDKYQQRIQSMRTSLSEAIGKKSICVMRFYTDLQFTQFLNQNSFAINVLEELEVLQIPPLQRQQQQVPNSDYGYINVSPELIDWLEADVMFVAIDPRAEPSFKFYAKSPLWQKLQVAQRQQIYFVDSGHWIFGNILSANAILDDIEKYLLNQHA